MNHLGNIGTSFVLLEHLGFMYLEMFAWAKPLGLKVFNMTPEKAKDTSALAANQGLYNGFLSAGLAWGLYLDITGKSTNNKINTTPGSASGNDVICFFLLCVVTAGAYGAYSVNKRIFKLQAMPAIITLLFRHFL